MSSSGLYSDLHEARASIMKSQNAEKSGVADGTDDPLFGSVNADLIVQSLTKKLKDSDFTDEEEEISEPSKLELREDYCSYSTWAFFKNDEEPTE